MKNLTPEHLRCTIGLCPAVYETPDGRLLVIGKRADVIPADWDTPFTVGENEHAILIDRELVSEVLK